MISRGHVHNLVPFSTYLRPDGLREVQSRCECGPGTVLEQKLLFDPATGTPVALKYRFGGLWFDPNDLLRVGAGLDVEECPLCGGEPPSVQGLPACGRCGGVGVTSAGSAIRPPELTVV